ncbi:MAG: hypothetical protein Q9208_006577 [Pyrenodesmia sp. 3 TL-2023]
MLSTWKFYGYRGHLSRRCAGLAWNRVFNEAVDDHHFDALIGTHARRWTVNCPDDGIVDVVVFPRPGMTWRMLAEGVKGAAMVILSGVEFRFEVTAEGIEEEVGYGETTRRKFAVPSRGDSLRRREVGMRRPSGTSMMMVPGVGVNVTLPDPYIWHREGMISTWEFYGYRGRLNRALALLVWNDALNEAVENLGFPLRRAQAWTRSAHGETADLELFPLEGMTWSMLVEASQGAALVNRELKEYQYIITAQGVEGEVGYGRLTMRKQRDLRIDRVA